MTYNIAALSRRSGRRRGGGVINGLFLGYNNLPVTALTGAAGTSFQLQARWGVDFATGADVLSSSAFATANAAFATVDAPTFTSIATAVTQGDTNVSHAIVGTNLRSGQTLGGLTTGLTAQPLVASSGTAATVLISATAGATTGTPAINIVDSTHGNSGTQTLTVNTAGITALPVTSGLVLRLHADYGVTIGTGVSIWADQSATAASFAQATTADQPSYIASAYNSRHCLRFNGSSQYLATSGIISALNTQDGTVLVVAKVTSTSANHYMFGNIDSTAHTGYGIWVDSNTAYALSQGDGSTEYKTEGSAPDTALHTTTGWTAQGSPTKQVIYLDNVNKNSNAYGQTANTTQVLAVGCKNDALGTLLFNGDICEIICFNRGLTSTELASMESYCVSQWGTP